MINLTKANSKLLIGVILAVLVGVVIFFINSSNKPNIVVSLIERPSSMEASYGPSGHIYPADITLILNDAIPNEEYPKLITINKITIDDNKNFIHSDELGPYPIYLGKGNAVKASKRIQINQSIKKIEIETTDGTITIKPSTLIL